MPGQTEVSDPDAATITSPRAEPTELSDLWKLHGTLAAALKTPPGVTGCSGSAAVAITS